MNTEPVTRAIVLRLYLNRAQTSALRRWQGGLRRAWNDTLDLCFKRREREGKWPDKAAIQNFVVKRLALYQRRVSRRLKGSKRREAAKRRLTRLHQRVANIRKNAAHQATSMLVRHAHQIVVESLNVKGMMRNCHLAKSVADAGMGEFLRQIAYKADWRQREVTEADRWYPSSRRCSACGEIHDMPLSKRWMSCACGNEMNRDENASRNLYAYPEERGNAGDILPKTRTERGVQELAAVPSPVPRNELRILKRGSEKRACVKHRFTEVNNSEDVDAA